MGVGQVIPAEAVEAAHRAWREQAALDGSIFEYNLQAALEAAAPYMMRDAWQRGNRAAVGRPNPYGGRRPMIPDEAGAAWRRWLRCLQRGHMWTDHPTANVEYCARCSSGITEEQRPTK